MSPLRYQFQILSTVFALMMFSSFSQRLVAQQTYYGDSDSFRGIEEQAKRRAKLEAESAMVSSVNAKHIAEVNRINAESSSHWEVLHANHSRTVLTHKAGITQNANLPAYLQRQYFDIVRLDLQKYDAEVQYLKDSNRAQIEYALVKNMTEILQNQQDAKNYESAAKQSKRLEDARRTYNATLETLRISRANALQLKNKRDADVTSYNQSFAAWKEVSNNSYQRPETTGGSAGSSGDDYDLAGALRDRLRSLNSGYNH